MNKLIGILILSKLSLKARLILLAAFDLNVSKESLNYDVVIKNRLNELINLPEDSLELIQVLNEIKLSKIKYKISVSFDPPTKKELIDYAVLNELMMNKSIAKISDKADDFLNYYDSNGWKVGKAKTPMVCWKKAFNLFASRDFGNEKKQDQIENSISAYLMIKQKRKNQSNNENN